ncbi:MAG: hypothetical protein ACYSX0_05625 [Planctomycetota bacterium]|jgi:hypothetical protein
MRVSALLLGLLAACTSVGGEGGKGTAAFLYVQSAKSMEFRSGTLTLRGLSPQTLFFSDRPDRIVGHLTFDGFLAHWDEGEDSFAVEPPNATLSVFHEGGVSDAVVELRRPRRAGDDLTYDVKILYGKPPAKGGACALFIDKDQNLHVIGRGAHYDKSEVIRRGMHVVPGNYVWRGSPGNRE